MTADKRKILMLNYEFPPIGGGAGRANLCLLNEFAGNHALQIDVLTSKPMPGITVEKLADNITIYKVGIYKKSLHHWRKSEVIAWLFKGYFRYRKLLKENQYDLAHAFFGFPTGLFCRLSAAKLPYIISLRGSDVPGQNARLAFEYKILAPLFRSIWKKSAALIACSEGLRQRALRFMPNADISVIPNGVDSQRFHCDPANKLSGKVKLLTIGRLSSTKRVEMLIDTVELLIDRGLDVKLTIAGAGAMEESLKRLISDKDIGAHIEMIGRVEPEKMPELYRAGDILLSASFQEGMSNAMLEAMASGLPVITTRCEGVDELIADNGIVVEDASAENIAAAVTALINDPAGFEAMSAKAVEVAAEFSWHSVACRYLAIYQAIIDNGDSGK